MHYYKITDKSSKLWKDFVALRQEERDINDRNESRVVEVTGFPREALGWCKTSGDRTFSFGGVQKKYIPKDSKAWRKVKGQPEYFEPNKRTKDGKEISKRLKDMESSDFFEIYKVLKVELPVGSFTIPTMEVCGETVVLALDEYVKKDSLIEITRTEIKNIMEGVKSNE